MPGLSRQELSALVVKDVALEDQSSQIAMVEKMILFRRDLVRLVRNFVNFSEFYGQRRAIFQAGTLYLDGRSCSLCLPVEDAAKHATVAGLARAFLVYCDCTRKDGEKRSIVAVVTGVALTSDGRAQRRVLRPQGQRLGCRSHAHHRESHWHPAGRLGALQAIRAHDRRAGGQARLGRR